MSARLLKVARRLRACTVEELQVRGRQEMTAWVESSVASGPETHPRARLAAGVPAAPEALLARLQGARPPFLPAFDELPAVVDAVRERCPADVDDVLARARRFADGRFDLLGYRDLSYGTPIDWHRDPIADRRAPLLHWSRVPYLDADAVGDHKVIWEVNRQQYLVTFGQAWQLTRDPRWAREVVAHLTAWMDANPAQRGINWASSLEVAYRAISWCWALRLVADADVLTPALAARVLGVLDRHGRHVARYLSTYFSPNTHLTGEALGLCYLGRQLPELADAPRWWAHGRGILLGQLARQVRPDGTYFEQATQYHRYTLEIYLHFLLLARGAGDAEVVDAVTPVVSRLADVLMHLTRPDGTIPLIGDDDGGRLVQLDGRPARDVRALLATCAAVLGRGDLAWVGHVGRPTEDVASLLWLLGPTQGLAPLDRTPLAPPAAGSHAAPDGGIYVMRDGWDADASCAAIDCGPHGVLNCGHAHADVLAIEATVRGRPLLVDAGTFNYVGDARNAFREGAAHNAVTVDGHGSSEPSTSFQWRHVADGRALAWGTTPRLDVLVGAHDGFRRLDDPVSHERTILFVKTTPAGARAPLWIVRDRLQAEGRHEVPAHWHLAPGLAAHVHGRAAEARDEAGRPLLRLATIGAEGAWSADAAFVSFAYGAREPAPVLRWRQLAGGAQDVITFLLADGADAPARQVRELATAHGRAALVEDASGARLLVLFGAGAPLRVEASGHAIETDAAWALVQWDDDGAPCWAALGGGRSLRVDGTALPTDEASAAAATSHVVLERVGAEWRRRPPTETED